MEYDLRKYLKVYDNVFTPDFCAATVAQLEKAPWDKHGYYDPTSGQTQSYEDDLYVSHFAIPNKEKIDKQIWEVIRTYIHDDMKAVNKWFNNWSGYSFVRFNRYSLGENMKVHCDHIHSLFEGARKGVPILTVLGGLNGDYEGGELIFWEQEEVKLNAGSVRVFPSNFLYPHQVDSIKSGTRYSYVSWVW